MGPNGPMPRPPPNHPLMMEMAALDKHLRGLYQQPQNADTQAQVGANENSFFVCFFSNTSLLLQIFNRLGLMFDGRQILENINLKANLILKIYKL